MRARAPARTRAGRAGEGGFSLVELLLAVTILGIGVLAVVGGMMTSIQVADLGRRQADGQTALRAYAEAVAGDPYTACASSYPASGFTVPAGWSASMTVAHWDPATRSFDPTCGTDRGLQRVTLTLTADDGRGTEMLRVGKRKP